MSDRDRRPMEEGAAGAPERWLVVRVARPPGEGEAELLADALAERGGGAVWEDGPYLVAHVPEPGDPDRWVSETRAELSAASGVPADGLEIETGWQRHQDWSELWKEGLAPRRVTPRIVVTPTWCDPEVGPGDLVVTLDPGMAFGNAEHGTTRGCIRLLDGVVRGGERILDIGSGSGVLSIVAALLGASDVTAVEADPWAVRTARENVRANGVEDRVTLREGRVGPSDLAALGPAEGVVANIEPGVLGALMPGFREALDPSGGWLVLSGIPAEEWERVRASAESHGFRLDAVDADEEWRSGLFVR